MKIKSIEPQADGTIRVHLTNGTSFDLPAREAMTVGGLLTKWGLAALHRDTTVESAQNYTHGIPGHIYRGQFHSPNGGISARVQRVTLVGPFVPELKGKFAQPVSDDAPAVTVTMTTPGHVVLVPVTPPAPDRTPYMASGAYVEMGGGSLYEDEWRAIFGHTGLVPLHDRTETWEQHRILTAD